MEPAQRVNEAQLEELRQNHIGRLLLHAQRDFSLRAITKLRVRGHTGLGLAHTSLLAQLDLGGTRLTTLAERVGVSKQAIGAVVAELEQSGYVTRGPDPADGRAVRISYTETGQQFLQDAYMVKRAIEAEYTALLGENGMHQLRELLTTLTSSNESAAGE
jgi:DNA-binding MarR family transcriptional regulator